ncbi:hypothetical protein [Cupriavidus sp. PET2-C1]
MPDVFGGNRRAVELLQVQTDAQRFQLEAAYITLASNVVAAAIQEASVRDQIAAVKRIISANTRSLEIMRGQFKYGSAAGIEVPARLRSSSHANSRNWTTSTIWPC